MDKKAKKGANGPDDKGKGTTHGPAKLPKLPVHSTAFEMELRRPAPRLGEHTREVLVELGLASDEIDALASRRVIP